MNIFRENGFTLVEVLVVLVLFTLILLGVTGLYLAQNRIIQTDTKELNAQTELLITLHTGITPELQAGSGILVSYNFNDIDYFSNENTLIFQTPALNFEREILPNLNDVLIIQQVDQDLVLLTEAHPQSRRQTGTRILLTDLSTVNFEYADNDDIANSNYVNVSLHKNTMSTTYKIYLRNKL